MAQLEFQSLTAAPAELPEGRYLLLVGIQHVPPHVALIENNTYLALTVKGPEVINPAHRVLSKLRKKQIPCLVLKLIYPENRLDPEVFFTERAPLLPGNSCIDPVVSFLHAESQFLPEKPFLHGLIEELQKLSLVECVWSLQEMPDARVIIPEYSASVIDDRIRELSA